MVTISDRNFHRRLLAFYKEYGVTVTMVTLGRGTATSEVLDSFGLEAAEKAIQFAFVTGRAVSYTHLTLPTNREV